MNKLITVSSGIAAFVIAGTATAGYQGMSMDLHTSSGFGDTYRIYVDLDDGARLDAVYGSSANSMYLGNTAGTYDNNFGGDTSLNINPALLAVFSSLAYDSWVTIGLTDSTGNALSVQTVDFGSGGDFASSSNGSWYVTPDDAQGEEVGGRVLIAQLTTTGSADDFYGNLNFQGKDADGNTWEATDQWLPAPGALALLGLAGIAGRRRRRA
jgi:MYXO-CTERM domain-containing protein